MAIKSADQISIMDMTDGYTVSLTSESYTFLGDIQYALAGSCTTQVICYQGGTAIPVNVGTCTCPAGVTATVTNNNTNAPTITIAVAANKISAPCEVTIPITVDDGIQFTKKFSIGVALKGSGGQDGTSVSITSTKVEYAVSDSGTTKPTSGWGTSVPTVADGQYLWTKTYVKYSDGKETESYSVSYKAKNGTDGKDGNDGADAITMSITSSNGTIFKNGSISTTLTAHIYVAGKELSANTSPTLASMGTIKWYKDSGTTAVATGQTLTITGEDVDTKAVYTAQLEG